MNQPSTTIGANSGIEPEEFFWQSELYFKSYFRSKRGKAYPHYDNSSILKFLFFHWVNKWVNLVSKQYVDPYRLHPLPVSDQILYWQPIFSKHISDALFRLESFENAKFKSGKVRLKLYYSVLLRAAIYTFWKRLLFLITGLIFVNILSMSIAILVKKLLGILNDKSFNFINTCLIIINPFQHGMCHRRKFANNINGSNPLNVCNQVLHSCSPDSECSKNPLFCQALRYQNKDINSRIFTLEFMDSYYVSLIFESIKYMIEFLSNFIYGIILMSFQLKINIWVLYILGFLFLVLIILMEIANTFVFKHISRIRDIRITKSNDIILSLPIIKKTLYDDIAITIITQLRNNELILFLVRALITYFNITLYTTCVNISFYIIKRYFIKSVNDATLITDIDTAGFMATIYIMLKIYNSMFLVPSSIKMFGMSYISYKRVEDYVKDCSPNFYISDNKYTGSVQTSTDIASATNQLPNDVVVYYKDATFTWVNSRENLLSQKYDPYLKNITFELKRGQMVIVTGAQGSGKSNFIKSMLGEMTLVGGSMAVVPLHTSMPIFYASQDIWLHQGTIRSNITFGYKFDEHLYNTVLKAVELEYDISTWLHGDLRVVSDNAHSLSGGQRVRMELARAVYAYMVFHQVNSDYNNNKCSFLMCLDSPFQGLDPYVSKSIFNNLFNLKTGLLLKDDLSIVLTSSKRYLEICSRMSDLTLVPNPPIFKVKNQTLKFYSTLHDFIKNNKVVKNDYNHSSPTHIGTYQMNYLTNDMLSLCSSGSTTRLGRREVTRSKYSKSRKSFLSDEFSGVKLNPYYVYMKPALITFVLYILLSVLLNIMDSAKYILSTELSDYITKYINKFKDGESVDLIKIKSRANLSMKVTTMFVSVIIVLSVLSTILYALGYIITSRKIHEYVVNSIFTNSSSAIKIKKDISQIITYFSCDIKIIDEDVGYFLSLVFIYLIQTLVNIFSLFYLIPISIPFVLVTLVILYKCILVQLTSSSKNIQFGYIEATTHINSVCENAITGSSTYRSFKKESQLVTSLIEQADYRMRCKYLLYSLTSWTSILSNWVFSLSILLVLVIPIILDRITDYTLKMGYLGLALSLCMNVLKSFDKFSSLYFKSMMAICSVLRFRYFIPPGHKLKFDRCLNTHEEHLVNPTRGAIKFDRNQLLTRRAAEFKDDNKRFYKLKRPFYCPKITILNVDNHLSPEHTGVELKDVCVHTGSHSAESMILKHFNVSAKRSEIIGVVGRTGAGKTTLLSVLQNIVENRTGLVLLDGMDLNKISKHVLRQVIGVLPQLPFVFKGWTIRRFLDPRKLFSDDDINDALDKCGLLNLVNELPGGNKLDSDYYKECDMLLSNSQLRTLSLARLVLYRNLFRVILVDEPPENSEEYEYGEQSLEYKDTGVPIYELLKAYFQHCTTFVTAHDVNVLKSCTSVWVIHDGFLVRTCKTSDIAASESIANIIEESLKCS
ncbi:ABC transporter [Theileria orientalis strain Shintoku]|uniref:ABC transporter n=1 Tax=Theileria orientalis strain Shintoku TaxID=869250 RepID=J4DPB2_THEOR|nr:ABC transporter [Theileria orientalis strain Shintoku]BAM40399.1 ABC transporter [Theileria orientalis strain Shintoku]|eukprot:XP_009690700.1 ABC transporter [Theileria orientalis strain Shintoku]